MSKPRHVGILNMCQRVGKTDMERIAALTAQAKGDRTSAAFAEVCGVNPGTMSRILNAKLKKNLSDDIIAAIVVNAANPSVSLFKSFLDAQGLSILAAEGKAAPEQDRIYSEYLNQVRAAVGMNRKASSADRKEAIIKRVREAVQNYLINKGYSVALRDPEIDMGLEFPWTADFALETNALQDEGLNKWAFVLSESVGQTFVQSIMHIAEMAYFGRPARQGYRITVVTTDESTFYVCRETLRDLAPAYDSISMLLVNPRYCLVEAEYVLERETAITQVMPKGKEDIDWQEIYGVPDD